MRLAARRGPNMNDSSQVIRCPWAEGDPLMQDYHDNEWGIAVWDAHALFERLILEGMQAGLSWRLVLERRPAMRRAFFGFDAGRLALASEDDQRRWLNDASLIRNRAKIASVVTNARAYLALDDPVAYFWSFVDGTPILGEWRKASEVPSQTGESRAMSKALKARGFKFVGPTICYALMQSAGLVNDHLLDCQFRQ